MLALAIVAIAALPAAAGAQATLAVDPVVPCYREQQKVFLQGAGFTPNTVVNFSRDGILLEPSRPIMTDAAGQLFPRLDLPPLVAGQRQLTYVATDSANTALTSQVSLLVTATDVLLRPASGPPHRLLTIRGRGFFGTSNTLYAHVLRTGKRARLVRNLRIGAVTGACRTVEARKRLFSRDTPPGDYRVQFDTFRRYERTRKVKTDVEVTIFRTAGTARAGGSSVSPAS